MRTIILAAAAVVGLAFPANAIAQRTGFGMTTTNGDLSGRAFLPISASPDWRRCSNEHRIHPLERAVESCDRMLAERPDYLVKGAIYWERAMRYLDAGDVAQFETDLARAGEAFDAEVIGDPRDDKGYTSRGGVLTRQGRFDEAMADFDHAIAIESNASWPHIGRGDILFRRGDYASAATAFDAAAHIAARTGETSPRHHSARCEARAAQRTDLERARALCDRGVRLTDEQSSALTSRGYFWFMQGDLARADADFARAIEEDPYNAPALHGRGVVAVRQGRAEGQADIARARQMDAFEVDYYANAGLTP